MGINGAVKRIDRTGYRLEHASKMNGSWSYAKGQKYSGILIFDSLGHLQRRYYKYILGPTFPSGDGYFIMDQVAVSKNMWNVYGNNGKLKEYATRRWEGEFKMIEERYDTNHEIRSLTTSELDRKYRPINEVGVTYNEYDSSVTVERYRIHYDQLNRIDTFWAIRDDKSINVYTYKLEDLDSFGNPRELTVFQNDTPVNYYSQKYEYFD